MPIFEYECTECGERVEHLQLSSDSPLKACPVCGAEVRKLMSAPAFQFKGTGWYVTDYAAKDKSGQADGNGAEKKAGDAKAADSGSKSSDKSGSSDSSASAGKPDTSKSGSKKTSSPAD